MTLEINSPITPDTVKQKLSEITLTIAQLEKTKQQRVRQMVNLIYELIEKQKLEEYVSQRLVTFPPSSPYPALNEQIQTFNDWMFILLHQVPVERDPDIKDAIIKTFALEFVKTVDILHQEKETLRPN